MSADGGLALSGGDDRTVRVWDVKSGRELKPLEGLSSEVYGVALSADGRRAAAGGIEWSAHVWDTESGRELTRLKHETSINDLALSADGRITVSGSPDHTVRVWDVRDGASLHTLAGHTGSVRSVALSADGGIAVVERLPCEVGPTAHSLAYLQTKKQKMGHALSLELPGPGSAPRGIEAQL